MLQQLQKSRWLRLIAYLTLCLGLVACGTNTPQQATSEALRGTQQARLKEVNTYQAPSLPVVMPTIDPNKILRPLNATDFYNPWLRGDPCAPPCWEGITPNETRLEHALELLNQHQFVKEIGIDVNEDVTISFTSDSDSYEGTLSYQKEPPYTIERINLYLPPVQLGELIAAYGEPSYVLVSTQSAPMPEGGPGSDPRIYHFGVVYPERGFLITYRDTISIHHIASGQHLTDFLFFGDSFQSLLDNELKSVWGGTLIPWQGYQSFEFYCEQVRTTINSYNECPYYALTRTPQPKNP
jgi:hypothetical protein